jgi:hypothetical protein
MQQSGISLSAPDASVLAGLFRRTTSNTGSSGNTAQQFANSGILGGAGVLGALSSLYQKLQQRPLVSGLRSATQQVGEAVSAIGQSASAQLRAGVQETEDAVAAHKAFGSSVVQVKNRTNLHPS